MSGQAPETRVRFARAGDAPLILQFIRELAEYERLSHEGRQESLFVHSLYPKSWSSCCTSWGLHVCGMRMQLR